MSWARKLWRHGQSFLPIDGYHFTRPLVILQSDDWGRVGLRDHEGLEQLRSAGLSLGERSYDLYTFETAEDISSLQALLSRHRDATGANACLGMNFIVANLDFARIVEAEFKELYLLPLADGLPEPWQRPGLFDAYREGIKNNVFYPALHGTTHFCRTPVESSLLSDERRGDILRKLWMAGTPYIHWRMPWIGYEYWDPNRLPDEQFMGEENQRKLIGDAVGMFAKLFHKLPRSACAPGYRADRATHRTWAGHGIRLAQNGPGTVTPPHFDRNGILHLYRTVEFEPATDPNFTIDSCLSRAEDCFARGIPAVLSMHSINFHSSVRDFRSRTIELLDHFLSILRTRHPDLLYVHDEAMYELVSKGSYETERGNVRVGVTRKRFNRSRLVSGKHASNN